MLTGGFLYCVGDELALGARYGTFQGALDENADQVRAEFGWTTHIGYGTGDLLGGFGGGGYRLVANGLTDERLACGACENGRWAHGT